MEHSALDILLARSEISEVIYRFSRAFDNHDWTLLRACFTDELDVNYQDFRNQPPAHITADRYVESRSQALTQLDTQHLSANHEITINNQQARCISSCIIYRRDPNLPSDNSFDTHCQYVHSLIKTREGWRINGIHQSVLWSVGNEKIHGYHQQRAAPPDGSNGVDN